MASVKFNISLDGSNLRFRNSFLAVYVGGKDEETQIFADRVLVDILSPLACRHFLKLGTAEYESLFMFYV